MNKFHPRTDILPAAQKYLWPLLDSLQHDFVLYGDTAIALRYGHRESVDFDFFGVLEFEPLIMRERHKILRAAEVLQIETNTLTVSVDTPHGPVKVSLFGGLQLGRVGEPEVSAGNGIKIASPLDLAVQKLKVIQVRSEAKDYLDLDCLLRNGVELPVAMGAAEALYENFPVNYALKAMCYFKDGDVETIPQEVKTRLQNGVMQFTGVLPVTKQSDCLL